MCGWGVEMRAVTVCCEYHHVKTVGQFLRPPYLFINVKAEHRALPTPQAFTTHNLLKKELQHVTFLGIHVLFL